MWWHQTIVIAVGFSEHFTKIIENKGEKEGAIMKNRNYHIEATIICILYYIKRLIISLGKLALTIVIIGRLEYGMAKIIAPMENGKIKIGRVVRNTEFDRKHPSTQRRLKNEIFFASGSCCGNRGDYIMLFHNYAFMRIIKEKTS